MIICIPAEGATRTAVLSDGLNKAPYLLILDTGDDSVKVVENSSPGRPAGMCQPLRVIIDHGVKVVLSRGMTLHGIAMLAASGIEVRRASATTVAEAIEDLDPRG
jgi:predicted Fe-Mo cluster-binding NifX family protein